MMEAERESNDSLGPHSPRCPRCHYDLRGAVATWNESCPLRGICAECGLDVWWAEVLLPEKFEPRWCIEFEPMKRRLLRAAAVTFVRSFLPWRFWRELKMSHPMRWGRLSAYVAMLLLPFVIVYAIWQASVAIHVRGLVQRDLDELQGFLAVNISAWQASLARITNPPPEWASQFSSNEQMQQRLQSSIQQIQSEITVLQQALQNPPRIEHSPVKAVIEAVFLPWAKSSSGRIVFPRGIPPHQVGPMSLTRPYPAPAELYQALATDSGMNLPGNRGGRWLPRAGRFHDMFGFITWSALWQIIFLGGLLLIPLSLILLPFSRRRAKVRWRHIGRVFAYSAFIPAAIILVAALGACVSMLAGERGDYLRVAVLRLQQYGPWLMLVAWWSVAFHVYLRIPRGWLIGPLHALLAYLVIMAIIWAIDQDFMLQISYEVLPTWLLLW